MQAAPTSVADRFDVANSAYSFNGTSQYISTSTAYSSPYDISTSVWFKTTTNTGGALLLFSSSIVGTVGSHDRMLYMGVDGNVYLGVYGNATVKTVNSGTAYNDGNWHLATATMSSTVGIKLYIDGVLSSGDATATIGQIHSGYWRLASQSIDIGWPSSPSSSFFNGSLDDAFIYGRVLTSAEVSKLYTAPYGVENNGPVCMGKTLQLVGPTFAGATYSWTGPNSFTSTLQNPTLTYSAAAAGTYTLQVNNNGCISSASTKVVSSALAGKWIGATSADWSVTSNWCNGVLPTATTDVVISTADVVNNPTLSGAGLTRNLTIESGRTLTVSGNGDLQIGGTITKNGTFTASDGKLTFAGSAAQVIQANLLSANLIKSLTINNSAGVTLNGTLSLSGILTMVSGNFNANNDYLTLVSSATKSANVAQIPASSAIYGRVKVEAFVKGGAINPYRTYRMFSSPVYDNTTTFTTTGARSATFLQLKDDMIVSGLAGATGGFDVTHNNQTTGYTYESTGYVPIPDINKTVAAGKGMYVFYRGNRDNLSGKTVSPYVPVEDNIVDFEGILNQQDITVPLTYNTSYPYNLMGNPYAATIDWSAAGWVKTGVDNAIWIWQPSIRGYATYINGVGQNAGSQYISSGQSFFVRANAAGGSITFKESVKAAAANSGKALLSTGKVIGAGTGAGNAKVLDAVTAHNFAPTSIVRVGVKSLTSYGQDEAVIVFKDGSDAKATDEDALHFDGEQINLTSLSADGASLAINFLPTDNSISEVLLSVPAAITGNYSLTFNLAEYNDGKSILFKDKYLNKLVPVNSSTTYNFDVDKNVAATFGANRFSLVFEQPTVLPVVLKEFTAKRAGDKVKLSWLVGSVLNTKNFKILRADQSAQFVDFATIAFNGSDTYTIYDDKPLLGINYYQLVEIDNNGKEQKLGVVKVDMSLDADPGLVVYPNPINTTASVQMLNLPKAKYQIGIFDLVGKKIKAYHVSNENLSNTYKIDMSGCAPGAYFIKVINANSGEIVGVEKVLKR